jgi:lipoyl(octanoyl) transferase
LESNDSALFVYCLGKTAYRKAYQLQEHLLNARINRQIPDVLLLLEHEPVITLGRGAKHDHLLADPQALTENGIGVFETNRGGDITYHGPGQLVGYPVIDLSSIERNVRRYVWSLEEVMIRVAETFGVRASRIQGLNGAWVGNSKIGAVGVRIDHWVTMHGFAFNVHTDLRAFDLIIPCGIRDRQVTSLSKELSRRVDVAEVLEVTVTHFATVFNKKGAIRNPEEILSAVE